jgi:hypothetical protein
MIIPLKENVVYESFECYKKLQEKILTMIFKSKTDKILYKGNPRDINYKLMKKVMLKDYTQRIDPDIIKKQYIEIINSCDYKSYCLIYKIK